MGTDTQGSALQSASQRLETVLLALEELLADRAAEHNMLREEVGELHKVNAAQAAEISRLKAELTALHQQRAALAQRLDHTINAVERMAGSAA
ncbi:hypothetical protein JCM17844_22910 [Iodidimonas gelatinilytica]|uniref:Uncharacterized protein n=1 Tax=Iodidimonas gelatinilytica TaxID=1236966 RepID=A0A5A7MSK7_9PROT|nr:hypothetical protein [Iodidimonas gelatinilytica]GEQ98654.1 hypothetical protein JCM17844_22910 [Iodidimonas gelatinilytica]GER01853.1 hypothetical protein JCM17845_24760 [Iodidimonas gelatinilytica]